MNKDKSICCATCVYAQQDRKASGYTQKYCARCELRDGCEICRGCKLRDGCKARKSPKYKQNCERRIEMICSKQELLWAAIQCTNPESEYHKALLNVSINGDMQDRITWSGCIDGERRRCGC